MAKKDYVKYICVSNNPDDYPVLSKDILNDSNVDELLNQYIENLDSFITMVENYLNGKTISKSNFEELSNSLYATYCNNDESEMIFRPLDMYYLGCIKGFLDDYKNGEYEGMVIDFADYFNVTVCDGVMFKYYPKNPNIVKKYIELNKKLDSFVSMDINLKDRNMNGLKKSYEDLIKAGEITANPDIEKLF